MSNRTKFMLTLTIILAATLMLVGYTLAQDEMPDEVHIFSLPIKTHPSQGDVREIADSTATLITSATGAFISLQTGELENGNVYTVWWVVINNPSACETSPCTPSDILGNSEAVQSEITLADGLIMDDEAQMVFASYLPVGEVVEGWFGNGFTDPMGAEIHLVVNDHGPLIPEMAATMINSYRGGCTDESLPPPFPETAKSDGQPGPNACRLIQVVAFVQES